MTRRRGVRARFLALGSALGLIAAGVVLWSLVGDVPGLTNPLRTVRIPTYLDPENADVLVARGAARDQLDVLQLLRDRMLSALPSRDRLWITQSGFASQANVDLWTEAGQVRFRTYPPYNVPIDPTWSEDPYDNISWQADYQSLGWLRAPAAAFLQTSEPKFRQEVKRYLLDWIEDSAADPPPSVRTWYDHSVAYRTDVIVLLLRDVLWEDLTTPELATVLTTLEKHGRLLDGYLREPGFYGHNHNLFHALSLYNLVTALPALRNAPTWKSDARARISSLLPEMVEPGEGASLEEAAAYHYLALRLFANADRYLSRHDDGLSTAERAVLDKMTEFGALLLTPTMQVPAIGDTPFGTSREERGLADLAEGGVTSAIAEYILSRGAKGTRPPDASFYPGAGYAIVRPAYSSGQEWADDLQLIVDTSARSRVHGHDDVMNVLLSSHGSPLLIDSGGPYVYGRQDHSAFVGPRAHNTVVDLGSPDARPGPVEDLVETDDARHTVIAGTFAVSDAVEDRRIVVLVKPDVVVIVDLLQATDNVPHEYALSYHLPPGSAVESDGAAGTVTAAGAAMGYRVVAARPVSSSVIEGEEDPLLGWVTEAYAQKSRAPVLSFVQRAATSWFVTVLTPSAAPSAGPPDVLAASDATGALRVVIESAGFGRTVLISAKGDVAFE